MTHVDIGKWPWKSWPRVARPYACRSCGTKYPAALHPEVDDKARHYMMEGTRADHEASGIAAALGLPFRPGVLMVHDRHNSFMWCRSSGCSRFHHYKPGRPTRAHPYAPRLTMRRKWLPMPAAANGPENP